MPATSKAITTHFTWRTPNSTPSCGGWRRPASRTAAIPGTRRTVNSIRGAAGAASTSAIPTGICWSCSRARRAGWRRPRRLDRDFLRHRLQCVPLDLVRRGARQFAHDPHEARDLVIGHSPAAERDHLSLVERRARARFDEGEADLPEPRVGHAAHHGLRDCWMLTDETFDLGGIGIGAADDEHLLEPAGDLQILGCVEPAEVAGAEPAIGRDGGSRRLLILEIALHHEIPAHPDFSLGAGRKLGTAERVRDDQLKIADFGAL